MTVSEKSSYDMVLRRWRNRFMIQGILVLVTLCILIFQYTPSINDLSLSSDSNSIGNINFDLLLDKSFYKENCFDGKLNKSLAFLPENLERWSNANHRKCQVLWRKFQTMYNFVVREGRSNFPPTFVSKVRDWLGGDDELMKEAYHQRVIEIYNQYNHEQTVFNLLRSKRPTSKQEQDPFDYARELNEKTILTCDFCNYKTMTAEDTFGRIEGHSSVSASNAFKLEKWHGLFLSKKHNPLDLNEEDFVDLFNTSVKWFKKAYSIDKESCYPMMIYDTLPKGGASQFHPHVHGFLATKYLSHMKIQNFAATAYKYEKGEEFWTDFIEIHHALGLTVRFGDAIALSPLTPVREHEVILLSNHPNTDLFRLFYYVVQTYYHSLKRVCFSSGLAYPPMCSKGKISPLPALVRVGTRGQCNSNINDVSSLELYLMQNVHMDPYVIIRELQKTVNDLKEWS